MKAPKTIPRSGPQETCTDYHALLRQGIQYCQQLGGDLWTDYNKHDPGVTILEQLCYAVTDLSYRTDFEIRDILAPAPGIAPPEQPLFTGDKVLTCNPLTTNDYRKFLFDRIKGLKNAWLMPVNDHPLGIHGLYEVLVETDEQAETLEDVAVIRQKVQQWMRASRNLGEDVAEVRILKPQPIRVEAVIEISPKVNPVNVLAKVLFDIQNSLIPFPQVRRVDQLFQNMQPDQIWNGPLLDLGALDKESLKELKRSIDVQDIANIILQVRGVKRVKHLRAGSPPGALSLKPIAIKEGHVPRLDPAILKQQESYTIAVELEGGVKWMVDCKAVWARIQELEEGMRNNIAYAARSMQAISYVQPPRGEYKDLENYFSIQHQFPAVYGLSKYGIGSDLLEGPKALSKTERHARVKQLRAYLLFFEQLLANYLAQLSHVSNLFSLDEDLRQSYFYQPLAHHPPRPSDAHKVVDVLIQHAGDFPRNRSHYLVCVVDPSGKIVFLTRRLKSPAQAQTMRQEIIESAQHRRHYRISRTSAGEMQLTLHNAAGDFLAMGLESFASIAAARAAAERWAHFMTGLVGVPQLLDKLVKIYRREELSLQIVDANLKIVMTSTGIQSQEDLERRIAEIIACGADRRNYHFSASTRGGFRIYLRNTRAELIAEGEESFETEFDAEEGVDELIVLLSRLERDQAARERHIRRLPEVEEIGRNPLRAYQESLTALARETDREYLSRRNSILTHLLARFGESFDDEILERQDFRPFGEKDGFYHELIRWKIEFLRHYVESASKGDANADGPTLGCDLALGSGRGRGFDYGATDGERATSGLERRLSLLLGIHGHTDGGEYYSMKKEGPADPGFYYLEKQVSQLEPISVPDDRGQRCIVAQHRISGSWRVGEPDLNDLHHNFVFSAEDSGILRRLLSSGTNRANYRLHGVGIEYHVLFCSPDSNQAIEIHHAHSREEAERAIASVIHYFQWLRDNAARAYAGERLHVVEHVLLRPHGDASKCTVQISNHKTGLHLSSHPLDREHRDEHLELILEQGQHAENYTIELDRSGHRILVLHHQHRHLATCTQPFASEQEAAAAILLLAELVRTVHRSPAARSRHVHPAAPDPFYSYRVSVLLPDWPLRFQSNEFKLYAEQMVQENSPAHLAVNCLWLSAHEMALFEEMYAQWKTLKLAVQTSDEALVPRSAPEQVAALNEVSERLKRFIEMLQAEHDRRFQAGDQ